VVRGFSGKVVAGGGPAYASVDVDGGGDRVVGGADVARATEHEHEHEQATTETLAEKTAIRLWFIDVYAIDELLQQLHPQEKEPRSAP
jgi:hypothetical protein